MAKTVGVKKKSRVAADPKSVVRPGEAKLKSQRASKRAAAKAKRAAEEKAMRAARKRDPRSAVRQGERKMPKFPKFE